MHDTVPLRKPPANSLVIPVYGNAGSIPELMHALADLHCSLDGDLEVVFVVDGSPDDSYRLLAEALVHAPFAAQLLAHSRNFGSFAAIRSGLAAARGQRFAVMAADLQEPIALAETFFKRLAADEADILVGTREGRRADPPLSRLASHAFWWLYRRLVLPQVPPGGVDVFACNAVFRERLLSLHEHHSSLVGLIFWLGFRRGVVGYTRLPRRHGRSAWSFRRRWRYMMDSVFAFTDLPIRLLLGAGVAGVGIALVLGLLVLGLRATGHVDVPGYAATMITILFFGALNLLGIGIVGAYVWRGYANTQARPLSVVMSARDFPGKGSA